jgi:hypothetical protein
LYVLYQPGLIKNLPSKIDTGLHHERSQPGIKIQTSFSQWKAHKFPMHPAGQKPLHKSFRQFGSERENIKFIKKDKALFTK